MTLITTGSLVPTELFATQMYSPASESITWPMLYTTLLSEAECTILPLFRMVTAASGTAEKAHMIIPGLPRLSLRGDEEVSSISTKGVSAGKHKLTHKNIKQSPQKIASETKEVMVVRSEEEKILRHSYSEKCLHRIRWLELRGLPGKHQMPGL